MRYLTFLALFFFCFVIDRDLLLTQDIEYIRAYDLGGQGLKTALFRYDRNTENMEQIQSKIQLGKCPDKLEVHEWIRSRMQDALQIDLDAEISAGYLFAFSLAGLNKLRSRPLDTADISILFKLPADRIQCIDDGAAHLLASLKTLNLQSFDGPIWNFALGTGVGWGFTNSEHQVRNLSDFEDFFDTSPWYVKELHTGTDVSISCSSFYGFDHIVHRNRGNVDKRVFTEFAARWKSCIEHCILTHSNISNKHWGKPVAVVFTGGHIDVYGDQFVHTLSTLDVSIPLFTGPKYAGLLGAAWNSVIHSYKPASLCTAIAALDVEKVNALLAQGTDINKQDALGNSPLSMAVTCESLELVQLLVENGAKINNYNFSGQTPIYFAIRSNNLDIIAFLLHKGADLNRTDYWNRTPLFFARGKKHIENLIHIYSKKER